jgi:hypothetical protein
LAVKSDGTSWAWGNSWYGRLGDGTTASRYAPVQVPALSGAAAATAYDRSLLLADEKPRTAPDVAGTWPANGSTERYVSRIVVGFDRPVVNVSADDLVLSAGSVTGVEGSRKGPYMFTVTALAGTWGKKFGQPTYGVRCDFNADGRVNILDLLMLANNGGK